MEKSTYLNDLWFDDMPNFLALVNGQFSSDQDVKLITNLALCNKDFILLYLYHFHLFAHLGQFLLVFEFTQKFVALDVMSKEMRIVLHQQLPRS